VTNALDMRYIWIDSLCIVQDDEKDWQREAARMAGVFGGSDLTIAAADSYNSHVGLFLDSIAPPSIHFKENDSSLSMVRFPLADFDRLALTCLNGRGWVFQELLLSKRKVYFAQDQLYWHCQSLGISEDNSSRWLGKRLLPQFSTLHTDNFRTGWHLLVQSYSQKLFTYQKDKVAAMAGIIKWYQDESQQTPVLGMWKESLMHDLAWVLTHDFNASPKKSPIPGLPSWTWLHWDYRVTFWTPKGAHQQEGVDLQVLDCTVTWIGEAITSGIKASRLRVKGLLKRLELKHEIWAGCDQVRLMVGDYSSNHCHICVDELGTYMLTNNDASRFLWADCLLLSCRVETKCKLSFLLVEHLFDGEEYPVYRRIGIGKLEIEKGGELHLPSIFLDAEPTNLELV